MGTERKDSLQQAVSPNLGLCLGKRNWRMRRRVQRPTVVLTSKCGLATSPPIMPGFSVFAYESQSFWNCSFKKIVSAYKRTHSGLSFQCFYSLLVSTAAITLKLWFVWEEHQGQHQWPSLWLELPVTHLSKLVLFAAFVCTTTRLNAHTKPTDFWVFKCGPDFCILLLTSVIFPLFD